MTDALAAAHQYVKRGWGVIPIYGIANGACMCDLGAACSSAGKHPRGRKKGWRQFQGGADVQAWYDDNPHDNVGTITGPESGIFAVDVDGPTGIASIVDLTREHGPMPTTRLVRTGSGGLHYVLNHPSHFVIHNSTSYIGKNIDIRGKGGMIVAPPSVSGTGPYEVLADVDVADAPDWLLTLLHEHSARVERGSRIEVVPGEDVDAESLPDRLRDLLSEKYEEGRFKRFERLHAIVAACFEAGYTQGQAVTMVAPWCGAVGKFGNRIPQEVARSWGKIELDKQREREWLGDDADSQPPKVPDVAPDAEVDFWAARPILTHLHDFARARRVSPWAVLGCALARIVVATPPQIHLPPIVGGKASLNLFVGLVGPSGSGKGAAEAVAADALQVGFITTHNVGSGEGIAHGYKRRVKGELEWVVHEVLFSVPEIDSLAAQGDRKGATLMPQLRSGWTGEQLGFGYADPMKRIIVEAHEYRMGLVAGIQPGRAGCLLDDSDGGTPQRFLWMPATDPAAPDNPPAQPKPKTWSHPVVPDPGPWRRGEMGVCDLARQTIITNRLARLRGEGDALDGHALLAQLKTAAALALAERRTAIDDDDWRLAGVVAQKSAATRGEVAELLYRKAVDANKGKAEAEASRAVLVDDKLVDAALHRACRTIVRKVRRDGGITGGAELKRCLNSKDRGNFDAAVEALLEAGQLQVTRTDRGSTYALEHDL